MNRPLRQLQPRRDVGERRLRIALLREERERARENPRARPFSFLFDSTGHGAYYTYLQVGMSMGSRFKVQPGA